jgi:dihydropteroate synthase
LPVDKDEPLAANVLRVGNSLLVGGEFPRTARLLADRGFDVRKVNVSEFAKAEGGLTCMSLLFKQRPQRRRIATPHEMEETKLGYRAKPREWKLIRHSLPIGGRTLVMGVINLTPDSFSDGGRWFTRKRAWDNAERMSQDGVDIIDFGGESTRPGAQAVSEEEEIRRVRRFIDVMMKLIHYRGPYSIDTTKAAVAAVALSAGVQIVNDISGLRFDPSLADVAARHEAGLILMHSRGTFETMHRQEPVDDILKEVAGDWLRAIAEAERRGVRREKIVLDPGIGFSKTQRQNVELIAKLDVLARDFSDFPLLVGTSRKSFVGHLLGGAPVNKRVHGTMATVAAAAMRGASIVRVHDVRAAVETVKVIDAIKNVSRGP